MVAVNTPASRRTNISVEKSEMVAASAIYQILHSHNKCNLGLLLCMQILRFRGQEHPDCNDEDREIRFKWPVRQMPFIEDFLFYYCSQLNHKASFLLVFK